MMIVNQLRFKNGKFFFFFIFHLLGFLIGAACGRCRTGLEEIDFDFRMIRSGFLSDFAAQPPKTLSANIISIRFISLQRSLKTLCYLTAFLTCSRVSYCC